MDRAHISWFFDDPDTFQIGIPQVHAEFLIELVSSHFSVNLVLT